MIAILDTGPWVALIDRSESRHAECVQWLKNFSGRLYSTEAVLTEVLYLLNFSIIAQCAALDFVLESVVEIVPAGTKSLKKTKNFMKKYADLPGIGKLYLEIRTGKIIFLGAYFYQALLFLSDQKKCCNL